jgi:phosphohistidine phosphatase
MGKFFLIRHGESGAAPSNGSDFSRTLTERGKSALNSLAATLLSHVKTPVHIHCSAAKRTVQTAEIIAAPFAGEIFPDRSLYTGGLHDYLDYLQAIRHEDQIFLVGHNPVVTELHYHLTGIWSTFNPGTCAILETTETERSSMQPFDAGTFRQVALHHPG